MELNLSQIQSVTFGAARVTEGNDGFHFYRFTENQQEKYKQTNENFYMKSFSSANILMDFTTNSKTLSLGVVFDSGSSRKYGYFDIFCDEKLIAHIGYDDIKPDLCSTEIYLNEGKKRIKIFFPWSFSTVLKYIKFDDGAEILPTKKSCKMLIFGDSITQGYDAVFPSNTYACKLADRLNADARNKAIGGDMFFPELLSEREDFEPDYITVAYGTNDWRHCDVPGKTKANMKEFYKRLVELYSDAKIFALAPIWRKDENLKTVTGLFSELAQMISETVEKYKNVTFINCYGFVPHNTELFADGNLHPNDEGFKYYSERIIEKIIE